jgi:hypothetical protein
MTPLDPTANNDSVCSTCEDSATAVQCESSTRSTIRFLNYRDDTVIRRDASSPVGRRGPHSNLRFVDAGEATGGDRED